MQTEMTGSATLRLRGVNHTARPTWKLKETVEFYGDVLGLPLVHTISARGWGPATHPDFLHFFFDSGNGSTIAFFYYLGSEPPAELKERPYMRPVPEDHVFDASHTAWAVDSVGELEAWRVRLQSKGIEVIETRHETIESIYFRDPNGYFIEITLQLRPLNRVDAMDAGLTLQAAIEREEEAARRGTRLTAIDEVWTRKAQLLEVQAAQVSSATALVRMFVPNVEEFAALVEAARGQRACRVTAPLADYHVIESGETLEFRRKELNLKPAVWNGLFTGGLRGRIEALDRDVVRVAPV
jgi:catechol 2,3-dioxygenase-like lactoylglutathione lyase family enzyme